MLVLLPNKILKQKAIYFSICFSATLFFFSDIIFFWIFIPFITFYVFFSYKELRYSDQGVFAYFLFRPFKRKVFLSKKKNISIKIYPNKGYHSLYSDSILIRGKFFIHLYSIQNLQKLKEITGLLEEKGNVVVLDTSKLSDVEKRANSL